ncbi:polymorphic toxin-type HINT domain-containing protein [Saccharibacillus deserti]|uniref:polymorphic toxin-type HINT domain-containing protein n=1 Tax=Saccharibacillus deserti TaxID=1634444 RepID=UPI001557193A
MKNVSNDSIKLLMSGSYEYAEYNTLGEVDAYDNYSSLSTYYVPAGHLAVFTNPNNATSITIKVPKELAQYSDSANPALYHHNLTPGASLEASNLTAGYATIKTNSRYDYAFYDTTGITKYDASALNTSFRPNASERVAFTNVGDTTDAIYAPYQAFRFSNRAQPITFKRVLEPGQTLKAVNTSRYSFSIAADNAHHYVLYKQADNQVDNFDNLVKANSHSVTKDEKFIVTNSGTSAMTVSGPIDAFDVTNRSEPALYKGYLNPGQSSKLFNTSPASFSMYTDGIYDQASYKTDSSLRSLDHDRAQSSLIMYSGERTTITNAGASQFVLLTPYDVTTVQASPNPALLIKQLAINQSTEFTSRAATAESIYFTGRHDLMDYDSLGNPDSYIKKSTTGYYGVAAAQKVAVMNTDESPIEVYGAYELYTAENRLNPVTFRQVLSPNQSFDFTNTATKSFSISPAGKYDLAQYNDNKPVEIQRDTTSSTQLIPLQNRMAITNTAAEPLIVEGPYDVFQMKTRSHPALFKHALAPRQSAEITYTGSGSGDVRLTAVYDYARFTGQELAQYGRDFSAATKQTIDSTERLAVMNRSNEIAIAYGAYDVFNVAARANPVTFRQTLNQGQSVDIVNTQPKAYNLYSVGGNFDYVGRLANGLVDQMGLDANLSTKVQQADEKIAITGVSASPAIIEGSFDAFRITARVNPALVKRTLQVGDTIEATNLEAVASVLRMGGKYDMAEFEADGSFKQYSRDFTSDQSIPVGGKMAVQNSDTQPYVVYGPYESFRITARATPVTFKKVLSPGETAAYIQNGRSNMYLQAEGVYDYALFDNEGKVKEYNVNEDSTRMIYKGDRIVFTGASNQSVTISGSYDAFTADAVKVKAVTAKVLEVGETYSLRNMSPGYFALKISGLHSYQRYDVSGKLIGSSDRTLMNQGFQSSERLVIGNVDAAPITVLAPTEAIRVTQGDDLLLKSLASGESMKAVNTSGSAARLSIDGKYDVAVYDAAGQTTANYERLSTGASAVVPAGGYAILTGRQAANTIVNANKDNFSFASHDRDALSIYSLPKDKWLKSFNVTDKSRTLKVSGSFTYRIEQQAEQIGNGPLSIGGGNTATIHNTSGKMVEVYSPYGLFRWEETTEPTIPPASGTPVASLSPSDYDEQTFYADPIDTSTGAQIITNTMLVAHGSVNIPFQAQYYSLLQGDGDLGKGWSHNYEIGLKELEEENAVRVHWSAFRYNTFNRNADGTYTSTDKAARDDQLKKNADGSYTLNRYEGTTYHFTAEGVLQSMNTAGGVELTLQYGTDGKLSSVTEPATGTKLRFAYNAAGLVTSVSDQADRTASFAYDAAGRLITLTDPAGQKTEYTYNEDDRIVTGALAGKERFANTYDADGRVLKQTDGLAGNSTSFAYGEAEGLFTTTITDRNGHVQKRIHDANHQLVEVQDALAGKTTYTYDEKGNRTGITNALGQTTTFEHDAQGNVTKATDPSGQSITMTYDARGDLLTATGPDGSRVTNTYDAKGRLLSTTDTEGNTVTYAYNDKGQLLSATDPQGGKTQYGYEDNRLIRVTQSTGEIDTIGYDAAGRMVSQTDGDGHTSEIVYNDGEQLTAVINALGHQTRYAYDDQNNLTSVTDAMGNVTRYSYDNNAQLTSVTDALGGKTAIQYDAEGRMIGVTDALNRQTTFTYDETGNLLSETNAEGASIRYAYDALGRPTEAYDALNNKVYTVEYDAAGNPVKMTDALGQTYTSTYNQLNQLTQSVDPLGRTTSYGYDKRSLLTGVTDALQGRTSQAADALGQVTQMADANGNPAKYEYDLLGRLTNETDAAGGSRTYTYNNVGLLSQDTDKNGRNTTYSYDAAGNVSQFTDEAGGVSYQYDANGNILSVTGSDGKVLKRTFDALDRVETYTDGDGNTIGYTYDAAGQLTTLTYPDGKKVQYTYNAVGSLSTVTDWKGRTTTYDYDANGRLISTNRPNGTRETLLYDAAGQLTSAAELNTDGSIRIETTYAYDAVGNLIQENSGEFENTRNDVVYDENGPGLSPNSGDLTVLGSSTVQQDVYGTSADMTDTLPPVGLSNLTAENQNAAGSNETTVTQDVYGLYGDLQMTYTTDNRLATVNGEAVTYDAEGNMLSGPLGGTTQAYRYDARNRLIEAGGVSYGYDNENNRNSITVNGVTTKQIINPHAVLSQVLMETDAAGTPQARYVYGLGLIGREDAAGSYRTYHYDMRGSTLALTGEQGQVTDTYTYDTYGERLSHEGAANQPFQYNGRDGVQTDTNGLYQMRARYYNPEIKRFVNRDVLSGSIGNGLTMNRYAYVNGNPVSYIDPFGLSADGAPWWQTGIDFGLDALPFVGTVKGIQEVFTGVDLITGQQLSVTDRVATGVGTAASLIPFGKHIGKYVAKESMDGGAWLLSKLGKESKASRLVNGCNCFTAGTQVKTDQGDKNIEEIQVGDRVLSQDDVTGEEGYKTVTATFDHVAEEIYTIHVGGQEIESTYNHPFWVEGKGWTYVKDLKVGDELEQADGTKLAIELIEQEQRNTRVYNMTVDEFHTYFVSDLGIWVHNTNDENCDIDKIARIINDIPGVCKKWGKCKDFADSFESNLKKNGISGQRINIISSTGQIYSEKLGRSVTDNGEHSAIRIGDVIYENLNPKGVPYKEWAGDLALTDPFFKQYFDLSKSYNF